MNRDVTLHDVAQAAGVSLATASRVLNGSSRKVADSYKERVRMAAATLGYTPNLSAQATARGTSTMVALLVADIADPYFGQVASGVVRAADEAGLVVTIAITERDPARELEMVRALKGQRPQAIILSASRMQGQDSQALRAELQGVTSRGGRVVVLGECDDICRGVQLANRAGARELGRRMAQLGYDRALVIGAVPGMIASDDRVAGFTDGFRAGGGIDVTVRPGRFTRESGEQDMATVLREGLEPGTLVFGVNDVVAIGASAAIRAAGREVGFDVPVCGFDDIPTSQDVTPALTTYHLPLVEAGYQAMRAALEGDWSPGPPLLGEVVVRESTPGL